MGNVICGWGSEQSSVDSLQDITPLPNDEGSVRENSISLEGSTSNAKGSTEGPASHADEPKSKSHVNAHTKDYTEDHEIWRVSLGAGCYWGTQSFMEKKFTKRPNLPPGELLEGAVGFMGPRSAPANPDYALVCTGTTKHVEVYDVKFKGGEEYFEAMLQFYFMFHDPTTRDRQGGDRGTQYASVVYCYNRTQFEIATRVKTELQDHLNKRRLGRAFTSSRIFTDIRMVQAQFYPAHLDHQEYLDKNPDGYCNHGVKFSKWPVVGEEEEGDLSAAE